jgi:hypothetical protein
MPSIAWGQWNTTRAAALDEIEAAHAAVGGTGPGRRYATEQVNHAYTVLLAAQFQGFSRDLHSECAEDLARSLTPAAMRSMVRLAFLLNRSLDRGNANPGALGSDFNRLDLEFWTGVYADDPRNPQRREALDELNAWRNAIAHQDFDPAVLGATPLHLAQVRVWRRACVGLAKSFDRVMHAHLLAMTGTSPW